MPTILRMDGEAPFDDIEGNKAFGRLVRKAIAPSANGLAGTLTANGVTAVTVAAPSITANSVVTFGLKTIGGTPAPVYMDTITPGTGFTVKSSAGNTSVYNWAIVN